MNRFKRWRERRKVRGDLQLLTPETCAQLLRAALRTGKAEPHVLLAIAVRAMLSTNPGEAASMEGYRDAILAGRRIKFGTYPIADFVPTGDVGEIETYANEEI